MPDDPLGITYVVPDGQEAIGVYEAEGGIPVVLVDIPYLMADATSLEAPIPVFDAGKPTWLDSAGQLMPSMPVSGLGDTPPLEENAVTDNGIPVTHNGETVTNG